MLNVVWCCHAQISKAFPEKTTFLERQHVAPKPIQIVYYYRLMHLSQMSKLPMLFAATHMITDVTLELCTENKALFFSSDVTAPSFFLKKYVAGTELN